MNHEVLEIKLQLKVVQVKLALHAGQFSVTIQRVVDIDIELFSWLARRSTFGRNRTTLFEESIGFSSVYPF